ncbi:RidA family protein [Brevibacterium antiquum]|uniref:RidA family protein n=1 Tax=Brevibacterium antiquum TaxID=234835 RepID=UPI0018DF4072
MNRESTSTPEARLEDRGLAIPEVAAPVAAYVPAVRTGQYIYTSGQLPVENGQPIHTGKVGAEVSLEQAQAAVRQCTLNALAAIRAIIGDLSAITRIVRVTGFVASTPDFTAQPQVVNGASELLGEIFGEVGVHARSAVGVAVLPLDVPVEVEMIVEV